MKNSILSFLLLIFVVHFGNTQQSFNAQLLSNYDPPTSYMPQVSGVQFNDIWGYASPGGKEIAIVGNSKWVLFLDVTNPATPTEIFKHSPGQREIWRDFKTYKSYAYGVCDGCNEGLWVYDLSGLDCGDPITVGANITSEFGQSHNIYVDEENGRLYAAGVPGAVDLYVYDLATDPANPQLLAAVDFNTVSGISSDLYVHDIYVRDNIAYCSHGFTGFYIWDMNDISNVGSTATGGTIQLLADGDYQGYNHSSWLTEDGSHAVIAEEVPSGEPLVTVDLTQLFSGNTISEVTQFQDKLENTGANSWPTPHNPYIRNDFIFLSYYEDGLKVYDYSDPANPTVHAYYDTYISNNGSYSGTSGAWGCYPYLPSGNILISDITFGISVISVGGTETCADGIQNQDETGLDCGGKYCLPCETCSDGIQNQDETGIDCGGSICCAPCPSICDGVDLVITTDVNTSFVKRYNNSVTTNGTVDFNPAANASYYAGNYLQLNPNVEVKLGSQLLLDIDVCQ